MCSRRIRPTNLNYLTLLIIRRNAWGILDGSACDRGSSRPGYSTCEADDHVEVGSITNMNTGQPDFTGTCSDHLAVDTTKEPLTPASQGHIRVLRYFDCTCQWKPHSFIENGCLGSAQTRGESSSSSFDCSCPSFPGCPNRTRTDRRDENLHNSTHHIH